MVRLSTGAEGWVIVLVRGEVTSTEMLAAYDRFLEASADAQRVLWDLSDACLDPIPLTEMRDLAAEVARRGRGRHRSGRTAVLCRRGVDFGLARMFVVLLGGEGSPVEAEVFFDRDEARVWLINGQMWPYANASRGPSLPAHFSSTPSAAISTR